MEGSRRLVSSLSLNTRHLGALAAAGYVRVQDLADVSPEDLSGDLRVDREEAAYIISEARKLISATEKDALQSTRAVDVIQQYRQSPPIITFCKYIDSMLGGGVRRGQLTELYGAPGTGKTHFGMQLALDVQIPRSFGGCEGTAVYIDTEGSFLAERVAEMAEAFLHHLQRIAKAGEKAERKQAVARLSTQVLLANIHVFRVVDDNILLKTIEYLPGFLERHPEVKIVVIDSLAFHLRQDTDFQTESNVNRAFILGMIGRELNRMAFEKNVAVVVTNHVTTRVEGQRTKLVPSLGETWAPYAATRIELSTAWGGRRCATLIKSANSQKQTVNFQITDLGVRDVKS